MKPRAMRRQFGPEEAWSIWSTSVLAFVIVLLLAPPLAAETLAPVAVFGASPSVASLDQLLSLPGDSAPLSETERTDRTVAVDLMRGAAGASPRLSGFRNRSHDLFRTERSIAIGAQEMLVRLRLRAKSRRAMSIELRF